MRLMFEAIIAGVKCPGADTGPETGVKAEDANEIPVRGY